MNARTRTPEEWTARGKDRFPGLIGMRCLTADPEAVITEFEVRDELYAPNGYLHAGSVVTLADTSCGYGTIINLPEGATGFTTIDLSSNFLGTARDGLVRCVAKPLHRGRTTQVWDAVVTAEATGRTMAHFRCTQMILWPK